MKNFFTSTEITPKFIEAVAESVEFYTLRAKLLYRTNPGENIKRCLGDLQHVRSILNAHNTFEEEPLREDGLRTYFRALKRFKRAAERAGRPIIARQVNFTLHYLLSSEFSADISHDG